MIVVGIDPSLTATGIAILRDGHPTHVTSIGVGGHDGADYRTRSRRLRAVNARVSRSLIGYGHITLAVIEGPAYGQFLPSTFDRAALWHGLYAALDHQNIPVAVVSPKTRAKWATGTGNARKTDVMAAVDTWWPGRARDDNQADALVLAAIGAHHLGDPMPFTPKPRHTTGLEAVQWPST